MRDPGTSHKNVDVFEPFREALRRDEPAYGPYMASLKQRRSDDEQRDREVAEWRRVWGVK